MENDIEIGKLTMKPNKPAEDARPRLGRGLAPSSAGPRQIRKAPQPRLARRKKFRSISPPNPRNPRKQFGEDQARRVDRLDQGKRDYPAASRAPRAGCSWHIRDHRRRAPLAGSERAGLHEVPIIQRRGRRPAGARTRRSSKTFSAATSTRSKRRRYEQLLDEFNYSQTDLAKVIGKSRSHVANSLRLLKLPSTPKSCA